MSKRKASALNDLAGRPSLKRARINGGSAPPILTGGDVQCHALSFSIDWFGGSDKGKKAHMEDRRIAIPDLRTKMKHSFFEQNTCRLFCIIDGHGGSAVASYVQNHIPSIFLENLNHYALSKVPGISTLSDLDAAEAEKTVSTLETDVVDIGDIQKALHSTFKDCDSKILKWLGPLKSEGATCSLVYLQNDFVFTANIGDSKAVLGRVSRETAEEKDWDDQDIKALLLTKDHTVLQLSEVRRIESCHGHVVNGRVNGILEVTRSFGDPELKKVGVSAAPHLSKFRVCRRDKFLIIACDGFWSVFSLSDAVEFVHSKFNHVSRPSVEEVTRMLLADAILNKQAKDNVSAIIIRFSHHHA